ncbi:transferase [Fulvivirgaceae bacterium PWU4]|uniref:Transferase n=1 Tax=Chryseosolibacter histidini TaxID=2782349 RepID=A0AAP2DIJ1_9BACT|nr:transferase [Chryseosolibacter histidini]MBT1696971.1 transferase [Chryseosolibacter histidini]
MYLLFPGRHQILTNFQFEYLHSIIYGKLNGYTDLHAKPLAVTEKVTAIIFAVTSANHSNTRRNPLPFYLRALAIQEFARELNVPAFIYGVDDVGNLSNFASYTLKRVRHESEGLFDLTPDNTLVLCSTPVLAMYEALGFKILPAELADRTTWSYRCPLPWDLVEKIAGDDAWSNNADIVRNVHPASRELWEKYKLGDKVKLLFRDTMISDDGDITTTRDYNTYVRQMDEIAELKYTETASYVKAGRIGDIGCAVGSWIKLACKDDRFRESDFYGIEVARHLFDICHQRKHNGEFANPFVFFSQRNAVTGLVFEANSMHTIHTSSLTHEIESYGSRSELLQFIRNRYLELASGGVWINRDVVAPANKEKIVLMKLNRSDGRNNDYDKPFSEREALKAYLKDLSTYGRFLRFAMDFRKKEGYFVRYKEVTIENEVYIELTLKDACEFMSRKDYIDNWQSEMHETFCFWDLGEWKQNLEQAGFTVAAESRAYTNEWIVENRLKGKVVLFEQTATGLLKLDYPVTNMILLGEKL